MMLPRAEVDALLTVRDMVPGDVVSLNLQLAQRLWLEADDRPLTADYGQMLLDSGPCWSVLRPDGSVLAACGFAEQLPTYAVAWALLAADIGALHLPLTRLVRQRIAEAPYLRIEALIRADHPEGGRWANLVGLRWAFRVRAAGPDGLDFDLHERVRPRLTVVR